MSPARLRDIIADEINQRRDVADVTKVRGVGGVFPLEVRDETGTVCHISIYQRRSGEHVGDDRIDDVRRLGSQIGASSPHDIRQLDADVLDRLVEALTTAGSGLDELAADARREHGLRKDASDDQSG